MSTNMPNLKQIGGGHCKTLVDLTWNELGWFLIHSTATLSLGHNTGKCSKVVITQSNSKEEAYSKNLDSSNVML